MAGDPLPELKPVCEDVPERPLGVTASLAADFHREPPVLGVIGGVLIGVDLVEEDLEALDAIPTELIPSLFVEPPGDPVKPLPKSDSPPDVNAPERPERFLFIPEGSFSFPELSDDTD